MIARCLPWAGLVFVCILSTACARSSPGSGEVRELSQAEVDELWDQADRLEPLGAPMVQTIADSAGITLVCTQTFRLIGVNPNPRPPILVTCCEGRCKVRPGGTLGDCLTSGCTANDGRCSSLSCSGSCEMEVACRPCSRSKLIFY
jgi:hypothetical protein